MKPSMLFAWALLVLLGSCVVPPVAGVIFGPEIGWLTLAGFVGAGIGLVIRVAIARDQKVCPNCAERVQKNALVCRYCSYDFQRGRAPSRTRRSGRAR